MFFIIKFKRLLYKNNLSFCWMGMLYGKPVTPFYIKSSMIKEFEYERYNFHSSHKSFFLIGWLITLLWSDTLWFVKTNYKIFQTSTKPASFGLFSSFSSYNFNKSNWKSVDGVLEIWTWGCSTVAQTKQRSYGGRPKKLLLLFWFYVLLLTSVCWAVPSRQFFVLHGLFCWSIIPKRGRYVENYPTLLQKLFAPNLAS